MACLSRLLGESIGGESGIRTHGSRESLVFKTSSLNHSDISPKIIIYDIIAGEICQSGICPGEK